MPVHHWTRVEAGIFHHFHNAWNLKLSDALNEGLLPSGYYALTEQHAGAYIANVLTLQAPSLQQDATTAPTAGGVAVAVAAPRVRRRLTASAAVRRRRTVAIRHITGHRLIALIEIVSPSNKDRAAHVEAFVDKARDALRHGVHLLVADLFPPGRYDPEGMPAAIWQRLGEEPFEPPPGEPLTLAAFVADRQPDVYLEHLAIGAPLPEMPLFLHPERYINLPLEPTYEAATRGMPAFWRDVLEGRSPPAS